jgi:two-component system, OmpR family, phosphate regulon sensor histidine kinase PhoR
MKNNKKLGIILLLVVSLPALFFSVYEIGSLNKNEEILEEIYNNQLEVILTSVNQYSDDVAESWASSLENILANQQNPDYNIRTLMNNNPSIKGFFYSKDTSYSNFRLLVKDNDPELRRQDSEIISLLLKNKDKTKKLFRYFKITSYRKIELLGSKESIGLSYFLFLTKDITGSAIVTGMMIDTREFINYILSRNIEMIREKFIVDIRQGNRRIYSSEPVEFNVISHQKKLWLLPDLKLGIAYKGKSLQQYVRERTYMNFTLIIIIDLLFLIGTWFVFKSFKTELQLAKMRSDFISNVSHEIRTPLALLSVYTETILLGRYKPEKLKEYHQVLHQETNRLTGIVNKILNFSKIEEKKYQYNFALLSLNEILETVLERFNYHLKNTGFVVEVNLAPDLPAMNGDKEALNEVITNLIDNAIKYSDTEKYLGISTTLENKLIHLVVSDKGIGIPTEQQKYIFEKFYRGNECDIHNIKGSGLGLAIVKHIVEGHKGTIKVESEPGKGSTFRITFPCTDIV